MIQDAHACLTEVCSGRVKELLAQVGRSSSSSSLSSSSSSSSGGGGSSSSSI